jgi:hypothetical protein
MQGDFTHEELRAAKEQCILEIGDEVLKPMHRLLHWMKIHRLKYMSDVKCYLAAVHDTTIAEVGEPLDCIADVLQTDWERREVASLNPPAPHAEQDAAAPPGLPSTAEATPSTLQADLLPPASGVSTQTLGPPDEEPFHPAIRPADANAEPLPLADFSRATVEPATPQPAPAADSETLVMPGDKTAGPPPAPATADQGNALTRKANMWFICYGAEEGAYPLKGNKCIGWLARLLARPNRVLTVAELRGDPDGKLAADAHLGGDLETDADGIQAIKNRLREIADIRSETGGSETLDNEEAALLRRLQAADAERQILAPARRAHHNIATQLRNFRQRLKEDMPTLFAHLVASLQLDLPDFGYYPPVGTPAWKI